jgi:hypothetical protein
LIFRCFLLFQKPFSCRASEGWHPGFLVFTNINSVILVKTICHSLFANSE